MKDRRAVTEQWFSVHLPGSVDPDWATLAQADFQVLEWQRHQRKLKTGTLRGNRFRLRLRDVDADQAQIETRLQALASHGMPNYFGPQRFGHAGNNLAEAARMFAARKRRVARARRSIYLSAVRAALFNRVLAARIENGLWATVLPGDALQLEGKSACFTSAEGDDSQYRLDQRDVHLTGPLCGEGTPLSSGAALAFEAAVLQPWQRWIDGLAGARVAAARRALRVLPQDLAWEVRDNDWLIEFALPAGSFATSLLAEVFSLDEVHDGTG
jgi:tRNA pseudouridine13 synthase